MDKKKVSLVVAILLLIIGTVYYFLNFKDSANSEHGEGTFEVPNEYKEKGLELGFDKELERNKKLAIEEYEKTLDKIKKEEKERERKSPTLISKEDSEVIDLTKNKTSDIQVVENKENNTITYNTNKISISVPNQSDNNVLNLSNRESIKQDSLNLGTKQKVNNKDTIMENTSINKVTNILKDYKVEDDNYGGFYGVNSNGEYIYLYDDLNKNLTVRGFDSKDIKITSEVVEKLNTSLDRTQIELALKNVIEKGIYESNGIDFTYYGDEVLIEF